MITKRTAQHFVTAAVLSIKVDAQCDEAATVVTGCQHARIDVQWQKETENRLSSKFRTRFGMEASVFVRVLEIEFRYNTEYDQPRAACVPRTSLIHSDVATERRLVTDRQTDRHRAVAPTALCVRVARQ